MSSNAAIVEVMAKMPSDTRLEPFTCVLVENFTIDIAGTTVPARAIAGQSFTIGQRGFALWKPPLPPLCFSTEVDTGWNTVDYAAGFSAGTPGQLQYRKIGNEVYLRGGATRTGNYTNDGTFYSVNLNMLPTEACPANVHRIAARGSDGRPCAVTITPSGDMNAASNGANGAAIVSWIDFSTSYLND